MEKVFEWNVSTQNAELSLHPGFSSEIFTLKALRGLDVDNDTILDSVNF